MRKKPKRYLLTISLTPDGNEFRTDFYQDPEGQFIDYDDYAKLQAENARLKSELERLGAFKTHTIIPNEQLQAHIERLTKAGDAFVSLLKNEEYDIKSLCQVAKWHAAKDGKDAQ
jgi:hypothetical protein